MGRKVELDHWLPQAKRLPVGRSARIHHGAETRPNLVVRNEAGRYSAYCHHCHEGGVQPKEFVSVVKAPPDPKVKNPKCPGALVAFKDAPEALKKELIEFLLTKDMHTALMPEFCYYSAQDKRLVFNTPDQVVGRDLTGASHAKWYSYTRSVQYNRAAFKDFKDQVVVLTEDYFSALKGQHYAPDHGLCVALMGTELHADLTVELCRAKFIVILMDNDKAGHTAAPKIQRTLELLGVPCVVDFPYANEDPKNMSSTWWIHAWNEYTKWT